MSVHDALFGAHGMTHSMQYQGDKGKVTVVLGEVTVLDKADAILGPVEGSNDILADDTEVKELTRTVDILINDTLTHGGLPDDYTNAIAIINSERWSIERIESMTATQQRIKVTRKVARNKSRSGLYRS